MSLLPRILNVKASISTSIQWLTFVGCVGIFARGFSVSAILMIVAVVLCVTLAVVSFFVGPDGGAHVAAAVSATFDMYSIVKGLADPSYSSSLVRSMCQDLCLGCGIIGTVASYTKYEAPKVWGFQALRCLF